MAPAWAASQGDLLAVLERAGLEVIADDRSHAIVAAEAQLVDGNGNGRSGMLNRLDAVTPHRPV